MDLNKRKHNLKLGIFGKGRLTEDEQGVIFDYMRVSDMVMDHIEKFDVFGARLYRGCIKPESYNFKGVTEWSFAR